MSTAPVTLSVYICTYQRPKLLLRLLESLAAQTNADGIELSVIVADNDAAESGRPTVEAFKGKAPFTLIYCVEPRKNIALVRNCAIANAPGEFIAFIDDDEFAVREWARLLMSTCERWQVDGVLGPVLPHFDEEPPGWIRRGGFYDRPRHETGFVMGWQECRTGNVLFRRAILSRMTEPFLAQFNNGGEDQDFFRRAIANGARFVWCDEAVVYETVPPNRWRRRFMIERALLRGRNSLRHPKGRIKGILKSMVAAPLYTLSLPFLLVAGHHLFMKYLVKLMDHLGRLLGVVGLNPVKQREM
jgi:succinoglycan biosynthesis protein ExoM